MTDTFIPAPDNQRQMRDALGLFATGVTVVTSNTMEGPMGITVNSFTSVSMDPPLILWCPAKSSNRHDAMASANRFALHIMSEEQDAITMGFVQSHDAFGTFAPEVSDHGVPLIPNCPARFECHIRDRIDAGDHTVIIGHVDRVTTNASTPRLFLSGGWGSFTPRD